MYKYLSLVIIYCLPLVVLGQEYGFIKGNMSDEKSKAIELSEQDKAIEIAEKSEQQSAAEAKANEEKAKARETYLRSKTPA